MKVKFTLSIGYSNARREEVMEFDDDTTADELECMWQDWVWETVDGGPHIIEE